MSLKKDKEKVFGGQWSEEQLKEFAEVKSYDGTDCDFLALKKAYQYMTAEAFAEFVEVFKQQGKNLEAQNLDGQTFVQYLQAHAQSEEYARVLNSAI